MHILQVIESLEFGGAEKVVIQLANRLSESHKVTVCLVKYRGELVDDLAENIEIIYLDLGEGIHFNLPRTIGEIIKTYSVDIINVHNWGIFVETFLAARRVKLAKVILTVHGPYSGYGPGLISLLKKKIRHYFEYLASKSAYMCKIVTVSDSIQEYIISDIGISGNKLLTIHNGISSIDIESIGENPVLNLITVGRLAAIKNQKMMLDALKICITGNNNIRLTIVGDGPERASLEEHARRQALTDHVDFLGFRRDIKELIAAHDIFLLSSDYEGISISLLEAMSLSRPTISTDVGGIPETIQHLKSGYLVPKGDVVKFAEAIDIVGGSSELRQDLGANARLYFEKNFHEDIFLEKYISLYKSCQKSICA